MNRIVVLGCGAVGRHIAVALSGASGLEVVSVDINQQALELLARDHPIQTRVADLSTIEGVTQAVENADLVVGAVPYSVGYTMLEGVIRAGKNIVDISYFEEDPFSLDSLAKEMGVTAVVDCGVAPGMANIILGDHTRRMSVSRYECYVGGIPKATDVPLGHKSPFPVLEVLEEYAGNSRMVENGTVVVRPMLSETASIEFSSVGTLACLNSDGLRTLIHTMNIPDMFEKTLRYPEHVAAMRVLHAGGFLDLTPVRVNNTSIRPIDVTAALLSQPWKYGEDEADITVMRLVISGYEDESPVTYTYDVYDEFDSDTRTPSMARTTGYTCTAVVELILDGAYSHRGISPPEFVGQTGNCRQLVERHLTERGVQLAVRRSQGP